MNHSIEQKDKYDDVRPVVVIMTIVFNGFVLDNIVKITAWKINVLHWDDETEELISRPGRDEINGFENGKDYIPNQFENIESGSII